MPLTEFQTDTALRIFAYLANEVRGLGGKDADLQRIVTDPKLRDRVAALIVPWSPSDAYPLTIDYNLTLDEMVALGRYESVGLEISAQYFGLPPLDREVVAELIIMDREPEDSGIPTDAVLVEFARRGLRPAMLAELLAFGARYPGDQVRCIVALGQHCFEHEGLHVPCLFERPGHRGPGINWRDCGWPESTVFLGIRKNR